MVSAIFFILHWPQCVYLVNIPEPVQYDICIGFTLWSEVWKWYMHYIYLSVCVHLWVHYVSNVILLLIVLLVSIMCHSRSKSVINLVAVLEGMNIFSILCCFNNLYEYSCYGTQKFVCHLQSDHTALSDCSIRVIAHFTRSWVIW